MSVPGLMNGTEPRGKSMLQELGQYDVAAGMYLGGLLQIATLEQSSHYRPAQWDPRMLNSVVVCVTAFGDLFAADRVTGLVHFIVVEIGEVVPFVTDWRSFWEERACKKSIREDMLHQAEFDILSRRLGDLKMGQCYAPDLILALGGSGAIEEYVVWDAPSYVAITLQSLLPRDVSH